MFLNNFKPFIARGLGFFTTQNQIEGMLPAVTNYEGTSQFFSYNTYRSVEVRSLMKNIASGIGTNLGSEAAVGVVFGTGNTAPTAEDYRLSGDFISGLSASNVTLVEQKTIADSGYSICYVYTISNTTQNDITIGEVGLTASLSRKTTESATTHYDAVLIERTALESPITIPAGGIGQVTYAITLQYPTF